MGLIFGQAEIKDHAGNILFPDVSPAIVMHYPISVSRMGAQVIAGVSFIGAGAIMMTKWQRVRGLTTAAGLWVVAVVGLCCGTAFYEGAVYATVLVLMAEVFFSKLEYRLLRDTKELTVYTEYVRRRGGVCPSAQFRWPRRIPAPAVPGRSCPADWARAKYSMPSNR